MLCQTIQLSIIPAFLHQDMKLYLLPAYSLICSFVPYKLGFLGRHFTHVLTFVYCSANSSLNQCYCLIYSAVGVSGSLLHFMYPVWPRCRQSTAKFTLHVQTELARCNHYSCHLHSQSNVSELFSIVCCQHNV